MNRETFSDQVGGVSGLIVHTMPEDMSTVTDRLNQLDGVEVHLSEPNGKLVITIEELPGQKVMVDRMTEISATEGVLSTALVYAHQE